MDNIVETYNNTNYLEKNIYFNNLSDQEKINIFKLLKADEIQKLVNYMTVNELKNLTNILDDDLKRELYKNLNNVQLQSYFYSLENLKQKEEFLNTIDNLKQDLKGYTTETLNNNIIENNIKISNAKVNIANNENIKKDTQKELKDVKKHIKKISTKEKNALKQLLKNSKPSILDKIGFISKIRLDILQTKIQKYNEIENELKETEMERLEKELILDNALNEIQNEQKNIENYKNEIKQNIIYIQNNKVTIKNISAIEKKALGIALYKKMCHIKDIVLTTSKKHTSKEEVVNESPQLNEVPKQQDTKSIIDDMMNAMETLNKLGVEFHQNTKPFGPQKDKNLLTTDYGTISPSEIIMLGEVITNYGNYLNEQKEIENAKKRMRTAGYINYTFIIFAITVITIVSVFIGTFLLK